MAFILMQPRGKIAACRSLLVGGLVLLAACESASFYWQASSGHLALMRKREPVAELLAAEELDPSLREGLEHAVAIRDYAAEQLALPVGGSYHHWVEVDGDAVTWNVFAAQPLALEAVQWCFPVAGCVTYRGYFERAQAEAFAAGLRQEGYDVYVGGASAYSTLGWFKDPLLSTFLSYGDIRLAGLLFHELAHQVVYVKGDTTFNESFASAVEALGVEQWLVDQGRAEELARYGQWRQDRAAFIDWLFRQRQGLEAIYDTTLDEASLREAKGAWYRDLWAVGYPEFKASRAGRSSFDHWQRGDWNNARLLSISSYNDWVPAFRHLFEQTACDWTAFYRQVEELAELAEQARTAALQVLQQRPPSPCEAAIGDQH